MTEKIAGNVFKTMWRKGKDHAIPDALSRAPSSKPTAEESLLGEDVQLAAVTCVNTVANEVGMADPSLKRIENATKEDREMQDLMAAISAGFPSDWERTWPLARPYKKIREHLSVVDDVVIFGTRIVVPASLRREILRELHASHQGLEKTKRRARMCIYWPGLNSDITNIIDSCEACQSVKPSLQKEPLVQTEVPEWVFQDVSSDLFSHAGRHYMVYVDRLSGWPIVAFFGKHEPNTTKIIRKLEKYFVDLGVPVRIRTDNGPQYASKELRQFLENWGVQHVTSSPHYPQSNGHAEACVKAMKSLVAKTGPGKSSEFRKGLLEYRNTPMFNGKSPSEVLFGHPTRSKVPLHRTMFSPNWLANREAAKAKMATEHEKRAHYYDRSSCPLKPLVQGEEVIMQDPRTKRWDEIGVVTEVLGNRDYLVQCRNGGEYRRNRRFLKIFRGKKTEQDLRHKDAKVRFRLPEKNKTNERYQLRPR